MLQLDDQCDYTDMLNELKAKVSDPALDGSAEVQLHLGYRYCTEAQYKEIVCLLYTSPSPRD